MESVGTSSITWHEDSHIFGAIIAKHEFTDRAMEIESALKALRVPFGPVSPLTTYGRPMTPKRQLVTISGERKPSIFPVSQRGLNKQLKESFKKHAWKGEPIAVGKTGGFSEKLGLKGDFVKDGVFVEVEFGNVASLSRDLLKFQIANRAEQGELGVLITATRRFAKFMDQGIATFEAAQALLPAMRLGIQMPIWIIGIEPTDWEPLETKYSEMLKTCEAAGIDCHPYESIDSAALEPEIGSPEEEIDPEEK